MTKENAIFITDAQPPSSNSVTSHGGQHNTMDWADHCCYGYHPAKMVNTLYAEPKEYSLAEPLKPALKSSGSRPLHKDARPAKSVSFLLDTTDRTDGHLKDVQFSRDQLEAMKQAVVMMGDHQEEVVQLVIDAHQLLLDSTFCFRGSEELCQRADILTHNPYVQTELRERIKELKMNREHEEAARDEAGCGAADNTSNDRGAAASGHEKHVEEKICPVPPAGMLADGQLSFSSSSPSFSPSSTPSSASSDTAYSSIAPSSASLTPLFLAALASVLQPYPLASVAPSSSSAAAPQDPKGHVSSAMLLTAPRASESAAAAAGRGQATVTTTTEKVPIHENARNLTKDEHNVTENVTQSAELATGALKCPAEMQDGSGASEDSSTTASSSNTSAAPNNNSSSSSSSREALEHVRALAVLNKRLKERQMCRACRKVDLSDSGITFLPCGHFITCESCAETFDDCPACGKNILGTVRTFLS